MNPFFTQPNTRPIRLLVIHCSATREDRTVTGADIDAAHRVRGFSEAGYHFYIRREGQIEKLRDLDKPGAHTRGHNAHSIGICYEGGLDTNGRPADTRTEAQKEALRLTVQSLLVRYPAAQVCGHRDLSPNLNHNGLIEKHEWIKVCPCFEVSAEQWT